MTTYALGVESAHDKLLHVELLILIVVLLALLLVVVARLGLALALGAVGLGVLHLVVRVLLGGLEELLDGGLAAGLLGLGGVAGPAVGLLLVRLLLVIVVVGAAQERLEVVVLILVIVVQVRLVDLQGGARDRGEVALAVGLGGRGGVNGGHGDANLGRTVSKKSRSEGGRKARSDTHTVAGNSISAGTMTSPTGTSRP